MTAEWVVLRRLLGGADTTYLYNTGDQLTSETAGGVTTTYLYDANGALTKSDDGTTVNAYTYDYDGYQTAFDTTGTDNDTTYAYDADKRRINKVVNSVTTKYFLDASNVIADYDGDDTLLATYVTPGPPRRVNLDNNVSQTRSGSTYYYMRDGLGSIRNVVESDEDTANTYDYYAFGKELGTWTQNVTNRYTYTAREYDAEAKQYYYRARYYAGEGIFGRRDPAGEGTNVYQYVHNHPANMCDPFGAKAEAHVTHGEIHITVHMTLYPATRTVTQANLDTAKTNIIAGVRTYWSGYSLGKCKVIVRASVETTMTSWSALIFADNEIAITDEGKANEFASKATDNTGTWHYKEEEWVFAHETGHLMLLKDEYNKVTGKATPGYEADIMAAPGNKAQLHEIVDILDLLHFFEKTERSEAGLKVTVPQECGCDPIVVPGRRNEAIKQK